MTDSHSNIDYRRARFLISAPALRNCPADHGAEIAFCGRSNSGKSSALNALTDQRKLARTSKTPGRTQQIVFFELDTEHRLVDLPGYGFARVSEAVKQQWQRELAAYLRGRESLRGLVLLVDIRRLITEFDANMLDWCAATSLPVHILLTKTDKLSKNKSSSALASVRKQLKDRSQVSIQLFSATAGTGIGEARQLLDQWFS